MFSVFVHASCYFKGHMYKCYLHAIFIISIYIMYNGFAPYLYCVFIFYIQVLGVHWNSYFCGHIGTTGFVNRLVFGTPWNSRFP